MQTEQTEVVNNDGLTETTDSEGHTVTIENNHTAAPMVPMEHHDEVCLPI
jgi:hypothetical protein